MPAAATGAALLAAGAALTNNAAYITQARSAISTANSLIAAVRDEDILRVSATEFANLEILTNLAHDGSLVHYWQNSTNGGFFWLGVCVLNAPSNVFIFHCMLDSSHET